MIHVNHHHFCRPARCAARLDGARRAITNLEEAHEAGGLAAAREFFAFAAQVREIRAGARAIFEQARFAHPEIHDAAFVDEIISHALNEAGMGLGVFIGRPGFGELAGFMVDVEVALAWSIDAIGPMQAGVEPLRRVRRAFLRGKHVAQLVVEGAGVIFSIEVSALPAPIGPCARQAVEDLL